MKLLAAVLWLALLIGSQASPLGKEPKPRLEQVIEAISDYATQVAETATALIQRSELGKEIKQWRLLRKSGEFLSELDGKLPPQIRERLRELSQLGDGLLREIMDALLVLQEKAEPYKEQLEAALMSYAEGPLDLVEPFGKRVSSLAPSAAELQEKLGSYAQELGLQELQSGLAAYTRELGQALSPVAEDLQGWISSRWGSLMQWFQ